MKIVKRMRAVRYLALVLCTLGVAFTAQASTLNHAGLDWLADPAETFQQSYDAVKARMQPGAALDGFRYATWAEVSDLFETRYADMLLGSGDAARDDALAFVTDFGLSSYPRTLVSSQVGDYWSWDAIFSDEGNGPGTSSLLFSFLVSTTPGRTCADPDFGVYPCSFSAGFYFNPDGEATDGGFSLLVRDGRASAVPLPGSALLFVTGFAGLAALRRRRSTVA